MASPFLDRVGVQGPPTVGLEILKAHRTGDLGFDQALTAWAVAASDQSHEWRPAIYSVCPTTALSYASGRIHGSRGFDRSIGRAVGDWLCSVRLTREENDSQISSMLWAIEKCDAQGLTENVKVLRNSIDRFHAAKFPHEAFRTCEACQRLDAQDRQREERGT